VAFSARIDEALVLAATAHREQVRKGSETPYFVHPVHVAMILLRHGFDEDLAIAGILHDTVEDTGVTIEEIAGRFGDEVARLVAGVTEKKVEGTEKRPWRIRKQEQLAHLATADKHVAALKAADALHNAACTVSDLRAQGPSVWDRFNAKREDSLWYYGSIATLVADRLGPSHPLALELQATVDRLAAP
jgi:(p)ppGpp synthase/HD superfamily hydrolase